MTEQESSSSGQRSRAVRLPSILRCSSEIRYCAIISAETYYLAHTRFQCMDTAGIVTLLLFNYSVWTSWIWFESQSHFITKSSRDLLILSESWKRLFEWVHCLDAWHDLCSTPRPSFSENLIYLFFPPKYYLLPGLHFRNYLLLLFCLWNVINVIFIHLKCDLMWYLFI